MNATIYEVALAREISFLNARAAALGARMANDALAPLGLKVRSYSVLSLATEAQAPSQRELAEFLQLDPSQIVSLVDGLERRGWVTRVADPSDRRIKVIVATEAGAEVCEQASRLTRLTEDASVRMLDEHERASLVELLRKVALRDNG